MQSVLNSPFQLQRALVTTQTDKDKVETELLKQQEKVNILETQVVKCQKDRENLEHEMEMLLDRIKKLSELLDKAKVGIFTKNNYYFNKEQESGSHATSLIMPD